METCSLKPTTFKELFVCPSSRGGQATWRKEKQTFRKWEQKTFQNKRTLKEDSCFPWDSIIPVCSSWTQSATVSGWTAGLSSAGDHHPNPRWTNSHKRSELRTWTVHRELVSNRSMDNKTWQQKTWWLKNEERDGASETTTLRTTSREHVRDNVPDKHPGQRPGQRPGPEPRWESIRI